MEQLGSDIEWQGIELAAFCLKNKEVDIFDGQVAVGGNTVFVHWQEQEFDGWTNFIAWGCAFIFLDRGVFIGCGDDIVFGEKQPDIFEIYRKWW